MNERVVCRQPMRRIINVRLKFSCLFFMEVRTTTFFFLYPSKCLSLSLGNIFSTEDAFVSAKKTDFLSFRSTFDIVMRNHFPRLDGKLAIRFVECRSICIEAINLLNNLSPYGTLNMTYDISQSETLPINAIPLFATSNPTYQTTLANAVASANRVYQEFISSTEGKFFSGQVRTKGNNDETFICLF